jgi:hypothetical protein
MKTPGAILDLACPAWMYRQIIKVDFGNRGSHILASIQYPLNYRISIHLPSRACNNADYLDLLHLM